MKLITVRCDNCGAPVQIGEDTRFATCNHCSSQLAVQHTDSATFTQRITDLESSTQRLEERVELIQLQNELREAEKEWTIFRERILTRGKTGELMEPTMASVHGARFFCALLVAGGTLLMAWGKEMELVYGFIAVVVGIGVFLGSLGAKRRTVSYRMAKNAHLMRRDELLRKIETARQR